MRAVLSIVAVLVWSSVVWGIVQAFQDPSYTVKIVEMDGFSEKSPVDAAQVRELAQVPTGEQNIFRIDLQKIENRILKNRWISSAHLEKKPPQTLAVSVRFREPRAVFQNKDGQLAYVDANGQVFGTLQSQIGDLPMLSGMEQDSEKLRLGVALLSEWNKIGSLSGVKISSISWDFERGYRLTVLYSTGSETGRSALNLGKNPEFSTEDGKKQIQRISSVFRYLTQHQIQARQIFAEVGKKIIVKIARRS